MMEELCFCLPQLDSLLIYPKKVDWCSALDSPYIIGGSSDSMFFM